MALERREQRSEPTAGSANVQSSSDGRNLKTGVGEKDTKPAGSIKNTISEAPMQSGQQRCQDLITNFVDVIKPMSAQKSRVIDIQLLKTICDGYQPFSLVEEEEFRKFVAMLNPSYKLPSRKTLTSSLLPTVYDELKSNVERDLAAAVGVALTCDGWTSVTNTSFYALTAHYFDKNVSIKSHLLECSEFSDRHTADNIRAWVTKIFDRFEIGAKVIALVTDNAANMKAAASLLKVPHLSCFAHTLNLVVQSAIKSSIKNVVDKSKSIVQFFKKSAHALANLNKMHVSLNMPKLKLKQDCPTRWNSTLDMLNRLLANKRAVVSTLALLDSNLGLEAHEWIIIEHTVQVLKIFDDVTVEISAEKNVSLSKSAVLVNIMMKHVRQSTVNETKLPPWSRN